MGVGQVGERVRRLDDEALDRIGLAGADGLADGAPVLGARGILAEEVRMMEHAALRVGDHLIAGPGVEREPVGAQLLVALRLRQHFGHFERGMGQRVVRRRQVGLAGLVDADERLQACLGTVGLRLVAADGVGGQAPRQIRRQAGGEDAGRFDNLVGGHPADLGDLFGRIGLHGLLQLVEAVGPRVNELVVVQVLVDDDVHPAHGHGAVGAGAQAQPHVGVGGILGAARVDDDDA